MKGVDRENISNLKFRLKHERRDDTEDGDRLAEDYAHEILRAYARRLHCAA